MKKSFLIYLIVLIFVSGIKSQDFKLNLVASNFIKPVDISSTGVQGDERLFITEKDGRIKILNKDGSVLTQLFLDIDSKVNSQANERGLLGLCFDPMYQTNGYFYVNYSNNSGHTTISRFKVLATNQNIADASSEKIILVVNQPFNNHNGGDINFGLDGYLYVALGDGGSGGDPGNRSQDPKNLLGKMLRIDINTESQAYLIPDDNPYKISTDTLPEIWAMGLRNPWRYSFDKASGQLWIADVGQDKWEEINTVPANKAKLNFGWRCYEGFVPFNTNDCGNISTYQQPVYAYENKFDIGCSVTGGYVYRGNKNPYLFGKYIYTDFCTGIFWALYQLNDGTWKNDVLADLENNDYSSFGVDNEGELYVAGLATGKIFKISNEPSNTEQIEKSSVIIELKRNPIDNVLSWTCSCENMNEIHWNIIDQKGSPVAQLISKSIILNDNYTISTESLPSGTYFLTSTSLKFKPVPFIITK